MTFFIFIMGLAVGSFLNVCIYRIPLKKSIITIPSHCPHCGGNISWIYKMPVISFLYLRGRCYNCKNKISWQYPVVELLTAIVFLILFLKLGISKVFIYYVLIVCLLIIISFIDVKNRIIPNSLLICGLIIFIISTIFLQQLHYDSILGGIMGGGFLYLVALVGQLLYKKQSMGGGDIKLMALVGLFTGWQGIIFIICITFISSALWSIIGMIIGKLQRISIIPFAPFITFSTFIYFMINFLF